MVFVNTGQYLFAVLGGALLGLAASLNYLLRGKVTGMSGVLYGMVSLNKGTNRPNAEQLPQKLTIIGGMLMASGIFFDIFGHSQGQLTGMIPFGSKESIVVGTSFVGFALAGLFVGFGTKLSNGCTSGHGLCGLARLSVRSLVAVCVFLLAAIAIGTLGYYVTSGPLSDQKFNPVIEINNLASANAFLAVGVLLPLISYLIARTSQNFDWRSYLKEQSVLFAVGVIFGTGLMVSGMTRRGKIMRFLQLGNDWDPSLLFVLATGVVINLITFNYASRVNKRAVINNSEFPPVPTTIDWRLIVGAAVFGIGWGIGFLCPGPFLMLFSVFSLQVQIVWGSCCIIGMFLAVWVGTIVDRQKVANVQAEQAPQNTPQPQPPPIQQNVGTPQQSSVVCFSKNLELDQVDQLKLNVENLESGHKQV